MLKRVLGNVAIALALVSPLQAQERFAVDAEAWQPIVECSGLLAPVELAKWYAVPRNWIDYRTRDRFGKDIVGRFTAPDTIRVLNTKVADTNVLHEEMLHYLLFWVEGDADGAHKRPEWRACGIKVSS